MGGLGSGKWRRPGRKTVDSYPALDANYLSIKGWLQPGRSGACQFFLGSGPNSEVIQISLRAGSAGAGGRFCGRRVFKLYLSRGRFLCRHCSRLVYASKYEKQSWQRASRRANKLRRRLGIAGMNVPKKPHGMPASVYKRLLEATLQAEMQAAEAGTARLLQLATGIGSRRRKSPQFTL